MNINNEETPGIMKRYIPSISILRIALIIAIFIPNQLMAQLGGGTYVIGTSGDYASFNDAVSAMASGISGPVIFEVQSDTYTEQVSIGVITGTSSTNTITFRSQTGDPDDVILTWNSGTENYTLQLSGTHYFNFEQITVEAQNSTYGRTVYVPVLSTKLSFTGNKIISPVLTGSSNALAMWINEVDTLFLTSNEFIGGYYGLVIIEGSSNEWVILDNNRFTDQDVYGVILEWIYSGTLDVRNNIITSSSLTYSAGLYDYDNNGNISYRNNQIFADMGYGFRTYHPNGTISNPVKVINNFFSIYNGVSGIYVEGFYNYIYNNSVKVGNMDNTGGGDGISISASSSNYSITNNIVANYAGGFAINAGSNASYVGNTNDLYTTGASLVIYNSVTYNTLANWQGTGWDSNSISIDPGFVADDDLHSFLPALIAGTTLPDVLDDIDGETRGAPYAIGADEIPKLNGFYSIGPGSPDYTTFNEAVADLVSGGISGSVTFSVESGTYNEQVLIGEIPGTSPTNTILFRSETGDPYDVVLTYDAPDAGNDYTVQLNGGDYITFENITIESQNTSYARAVLVDINSTELTFNGNIFRLPVGITSGWNNSGVYFNYLNRSYFTSNTFENGYGGLTIWGGDASSYIMIDSCEFSEQYLAGIILQQVGNGVSVKDNTIYSSSTGFIYGIYSSQSGGGVYFERNQIYISATINTSYGGYINTGNIVGNTNYWRNNFISTNNGYGFYLSSAGYTYLHNNSVNMWDNNIGPALYINSGVTATVQVYNNILSHFAGGYAIQDLGSPSYYIGDYNDLYTTGTYIGYSSSVDRTDLTDWQTNTGQDLNSISLDPEFVANDDLHTYLPDLNAGTFLSGVSPDIDGEDRGTPYAIGADEYTLLNGLLAYYPLDGDLDDYSGNSRHATGVNTSFTDDVNKNTNSALDFNGSNSYGWTAHDAGLNVSYQSETFWFKTDISDTEQTLITKGARTPGAGNSGNYRIWIGSDNYIYFAYRGSTQDHTSRFTEPIIPDKWYHVASVLDGFNVLLYVNTVLADSISPSPEGPMTNVEEILMGANYDSTIQIVNYFQGTLDEVRIYNRNLTADEIEDTYWDVLEPMQGTYAIGPTAVDYGTINDAVADLSGRGISGDVTLNIESGTYDEQIYMSYIEGSDTVGIVFQSEAMDSSQVKITNFADASDNYTLMLDEMMNIKFQHLTFEATNPDYGTVIELLPGSYNVDFVSNQFLGIPGAAQGDSLYIVHRDWYDWGHDTLIVFWNNLFKDGSRGIYYEESQGIVVFNNTFLDQTVNAVTLIDVGKPSVNRNTISSSYPTYWSGIYVGSTTYEDDTYGYPRIKRNKISMPGNRRLTWGIYVGDSYPDPGNPGQVYNNFIHIEMQSDSITGGINISGGSSINVYHNSSNITGIPTSNSRAMSLRDVDNITLRNNIFNNLADSRAISTSLSITNLDSDYNNFYTNGDTLGIFSPVGWTPDLTSWQTATGGDANSRNDTIQFTTNSDLHLLTSSMAFGTPLVGTVDVDIDGEDRSDTAPFVGADEVASLKFDSLVLVQMYNDMGGTSWTSSAGWFSSPIDQWQGVTVENGRVTRISLQGNNLSGSIPVVIGQLDSLHYLDMGGNAVTGSIPAEIGNLSKIDTLGLAGNQLTGDLPTSLGNLTNLVTLWIDDNQLSGTFPDEFTNLTSLTTVYAQNNLFSGVLPEVLGSISNLKELSLHNNFIGGAVPDTIQWLSGLTHLFLQDNDFNSFPDLSGIGGLVYVDISGNQFTFEHIEANTALGGTFIYSPQDSIGTAQTIQADLFGPFTVSVAVGGSSNQYQWYKDDVIISGATSSSYTDDQAEASDFGDYHCVITNTIATGLNLYSKIITVESSGGTVGMIGTYTINAAGGGDFLSFTDAVDSMLNSVLIGNVTFKVAAGTYPEQVYIPAIPGSSDTTQVVFEPDAGVDSTQILITTTSGSDVNNYTVWIDGGQYITFRNMSISNYGSNYCTVVKITSDSYKVDITNNNISAPFSVWNNWESAVFNIEGNNSNTMNHTIQNNYIEGGGIGIGLNGGGVDNDNLLVIDNVLINQLEIGINTSQCENVEIVGNQITSDSPVIRAIEIFESGEGLRIHNNNIHLEPSESNGWVVGVRFIQSNGASGSELMIYNNFIHLITDGGFGIEFESTTYVKTLHNTVWLEENWYGPAAVTVLANSSNISVINNILYTKTSYAIACYNSSGFISNYNDIYSTGTDIGYWLTGPQSTLSNWQTVSSQDANSVSIKPDFVAANDLHVTTRALDNLGIFLAQVTDDIDGELRSTETPDIGADEYVSDNLPDFTITSLVVTPGTALIGDNVSFDGRIENIGELDLLYVFTNLRVYLSSNSTYEVGQDSLLLEFPFDSIDASGYITFALNYTFGNNFVPGNYQLLFIADQDNVQQEEDETNNQVEFGFVLNGLPDLTVESPAVNPFAATIGQSVTFSSLIKNIGSGDLSATTTSLRVYLSRDDIIDVGSDTILFEYSFSNLNATSQISFSDTYTFPDGHPTGEYFALYSVDPTDIIIESDEANNETNTNFSLSSSAGIDLTVSNQSVAPVNATLGQNVDFSYLVENIGDTDLSGISTSFRIYLSTDKVVNDGIDSLLFETQFSDLVAGNSFGNTESKTFTSENYSVGDYYILFVVDPFDIVTEGNESNNLFDIAFSLGSSVGIDLAISNESVNPVSAKIGETVSFSCDINNLGDTDLASTPTNLRVYLSSDDIAGDASDSLLREYPFSDLAVAGSIFFSDTYTFGTGYLTGDFNILFVVDQLDSVTEGNENNNKNSVAFSLSPADAPDLIPINVSVNPVSAIIGDLVSFNCAIYNIGTLDLISTNTNLRVYLSADAILNVNADSLLITYVFSDIVAGNFTPFSDNFTFPDTYLPGNYNILFVLDQDGTVTESNENNNVASTPFDLSRPDLPDLTVTNMNVSPASATIGQSVTFSANIENQGTDDLIGTSTSLQVYLSSDGIIDIGIDSLLHEELFSDISAFGFINFGFNETFDSYSEGSYTVIFVVDQGDNVVESIESNNIFTQPLTLSSAFGIDLTLSSPSVTPSSVTVGQSVDLSCVIENVGDTDLFSTETKLRVYLSYDQSVSVGVDSLLSEYSFTDLLANNTDNYMDSYTFSTDYPIGSYFVLFVIDPLDSISESNESNNLVSTALSLSLSSGVDLALSNIIVNPTSLRIGESTNIVFDVYNYGESDLSSISTSVKVYLSSDAVINEGTDPLLYQDFFSDLAIGASRNYSENITISEGYPTGNVNILFTVDPDNAVIENNESNNLANNPFTITGPDLVITNESINPSPIDKYSSFNLVCNVFNSGNESTSATSTFSAYLSTDSNLDGGDLLLTTLTVSPIGSPGSALINETVTFSTDVTIGAYYVLFIADANFNVPELDESNNITSIPVTVEGVDNEPPSFSNPDYPNEFMSSIGIQPYGVTVNDNVQVDRADIIYKGIMESESNWTISPIVDDGGGNYSVSLEESVFSDEIGIMFLFRAFDTAGNSDSTELFYTYIKYGDGDAPLLSGLPSSASDSLKYKIVAIPYVFSPGGNTVSAIFEDDLDSIKQSNIRMFSFNGSGYSELGSGGAIQRGKGYWLLKIKNTSIDFGEAMAGEETPSNPFTTNVSSGWNMVGNPYPFNIDWNDVVTANQGSVGLSQFTIWDGGYDDQTNGELSMFEGAFVRADAGATIQIPMAKFGSGGGRNSIVQDQDIYNPLTAPSWKLGLTLQANGFTNAIGGIGMNQNALNNGDYLDKIALPRFYTHLEINHTDNTYLGSPVTHSIVESNSEYTWNFEVETNLKSDVATISWDNYYFGDNDRQLILYDLDNQVEVNMREEMTYTFANMGVNHFVIKLGGPELLEPDINLFENAYPNPFNQYLKVRFNLPHAQDIYDVNLDVFSTLGLKVKTITKGSLAEGYHEIIWDGMNDNGHEVSGGVYILRMSVDTGMETKNYIQRVIKR